MSERERMRRIFKEVLTPFWVVGAALSVIGAWANNGYVLSAIYLADCIILWLLVRRFHRLYPR